jgi:cyclophilin family peptidyl-prolyl cis-trans isomerase
MIQSSTTSPTLPSRLPIASLAVVAVLVIVAVLVGQAMEWADHPAPTGVFASCRTAPATGPHTFAGPPSMCIDKTRNYSATITTTKGDIGIVFLTSSTPVTVNNFIVLAVNGYFNGQPFLPGGSFYLQSGDPEGTGRGGPGYVLPDEPSTDTWVPGSVGMTRLPDQGLSGSQFFITTTDFPNGPPTTVYNHFATVVLGFDKVSTITPGDRILSVSVKRT